MSELAAVIARRDAVLFTGAGFSLAARDRRGRPLPTTEALTAELWQLVYGATPRDTSTLEDLYDVAITRCRDRLAAYIDERLRVGSEALPPFYRTWFAAPWRAIYTLNVDDLEDVVAARLGLALPPVIHLNGKVGDPVEELTFSTRQYGARLAVRQRAYERLVGDLERLPAVFVGMTLDESPLWQHLETQGGVNHRRRPPGYLVARALPRARRELLASIGITWIEARAEDIARLIGQ